MIELMIVGFFFFLILGRSIIEELFDTTTKLIFNSVWLGAILGLILFFFISVFASINCEYEYIIDSQVPIYKTILVRDNVEIDSYYIWKDAGFRILTGEPNKKVFKRAIEQSQIRYTPDELPRFIYYKAQYKNQFLRSKLSLFQGNFLEVHVPDKYIKFDLDLNEKQPG